MFYYIVKIGYFFQSTKFILKVIVRYTQRLLSYQLTYLV